jgi:hypothetical protein
MRTVNGRPLVGEPFHRPVNGPRRERVRFPDEVVVPNPWDPIFFLFTSLLGIVCMAGLMTILGVLYVTVRPVSQPVYRRLASQLGAASVLDALALLLPNTKILLTGDSDVPNPVGISLLLSNHVVDADWWAMLMLGRCVGLRGTLKIFLRNEFLHVKTNAEGSVSSRSTLATSNSSSRIVASTRSENGNGSPSSYSPNSQKSSTDCNGRRLASQDLTILAKLLHMFLEFPLINGEDSSTSDRAQLSQLLHSFAENSGAVPIHLLLFPESWSVHNGADRHSIHAKCNEFAKRDGRPQLKHLLLPKTRGFKTSLECLLESSPVVYDVTMVRSTT